MMRNVISALLFLVLSVVTAGALPAGCSAAQGPDLDPNGQHQV